MVLATNKGCLSNMFPGERQQMRLLVGGVALALLPVLLLTVLPTILHLPSQDIVDGRISGLFLGLLPLAVGYAILRYQILIFDRYIRRAVAGIVGSVGLALFGFFMITLNDILLSAHVTFAPPLCRGSYYTGDSIYLDKHESDHRPPLFQRSPALSPYYR